MSKPLAVLQHSFTMCVRVGEAYGALIIVSNIMDKSLNFLFAFFTQKGGHVPIPQHHCFSPHQIAVQCVYEVIVIANLI